MVNQSIPRSLLSDLEPASDNTDNNHGDETDTRNTAILHSNSQVESATSGPSSDEEEAEEDYYTKKAFKRLDSRLITK